MPDTGSPMVPLLGSLWLCTLGGSAYLAYMWDRTRKQLQEMPRLHSNLLAFQSQGQKDRATLEEQRRENDDQKREITSLNEQIEKLQVELEKRPTLSKTLYRIVTVGVTGCGKTALTLKWASPIADTKNLRGTRFDSYQRTVSRQIIPGKKLMIDHIFEILDWGGEHLPEALTSLITVGDIHAVLMVVDLADAANTVSKERVARQLEQFSKNTLPFFFAPAIVAKCRSYVLFINKADLLVGTPDEIHREACSIYEPLIRDLTYLCEKNSVNFEVFVGSAGNGTNTIHLYSHLISRILPENGMDEQLLYVPRGASEGPVAPGQPRPAAPQGELTHMANGRPRANPAPAYGPSAERPPFPPR